MIIKVIANKVVNISSGNFGLYNRVIDIECDVSSIVSSLEESYIHTETDVCSVVCRYKTDDYYDVVCEFSCEFNPNGIESPDNRSFEEWLEDSVIQFRNENSY